MSKDQSKDKPKTDVQSSAILQVSVSFDKQRSVLPPRDALPPLQLILPSIQPIALPYYTVNGEPPPEPSAKKETGKKDSAPAESAAKISLVPEIRREVELQNTANYIQPFLTGTVRLALGATDGADKGGKDKDKAQAAASSASNASTLTLSSSMLLVDLPIRSPFSLTVALGADAEVTLAGSLAISIFKSSHTTDGVPQRFLSFLPQSITEESENVFILRIISFQGVPIVSDIGYRKMFFEPVKVALTVFGATIYSDPIPQELIGGTNASDTGPQSQRISMQYTTSSNTALGLCFAKTFAGPEELSALVRDLSSTPAKLEIFYQNPLHLTQKDTNQANPAQSAKGGAKREKDAAPAEAEDRLLTFSATAEVDLSPLLEDRVLNASVRIIPSFAQKVAQVPSLSKVVLQHAVCTSVADKVYPIPQALALGSWDNAVFKVQAATAGPMRGSKYNLNVSADFATTSSTMQHFERAYFYLKSADVYTASIILSYVAQRNINAVRIMNPEMAKQFEQPVGSLWQGKDGNNSSGGTSGTGAQPIPISDATTVDDIMARPEFTREDTQEWLSQCSSSLRILSIDTVREKFESVKTSNSTKAPFITGWHFSDPNFQLICLEAPACYGLLRTIAQKVDSIVKLQVDQPADTLMGPCTKCGPNVQFYQRLMPTSSLLLERFCFISNIRKLAEKSSSWTNMAANPQNKRALTNILALFTLTMVEDEPIYDLLGKVVKQNFCAKYAPISMNMRQIAGLKAFLDESDIKSLKTWAGGMHPANFRTINLLSYKNGPVIPSVSTRGDPMQQTWSITMEPASAQSTRPHGFCESISVDVSLMRPDQEDVADYKMTLGATAHEVSDLLRKGTDIRSCSKEHKRKVSTSDHEPTANALLGLTKRLKNELYDLSGSQFQNMREMLNSTEKAIVTKILDSTLLPQRSKAAVADAVTGKSKFIYSNQTLGVNNIQSKCRDLLAQQTKGKGIFLQNDYVDEPLPHLGQYSSKGTREYVLEKRYLNTPNLKCRPFESSGQHWRADARPTVDQYKKDDLALPWDEDTIQRMLLAKPPANDAKPPEGKPVFHTYTKTAEYFDTSEARMRSVIRDDAEYQEALQKKMKQDWKDKVVVGHTHVNLPKVNRTDAEGRSRSSLSRPLLQDEPMKYSLKLVNSKANINNMTLLFSQQPWVDPAKGDYGALLEKSKPISLKKASDVNPALVNEIIAIARQSRLVFKSKEEADTITEDEKKKRCAELRRKATHRLMLKMRSLKPEEIECIDTNELTRMAKHIISKNGEGHYDLNLVQFNNHTGVHASDLIERSPRKMARPFND